MQIRLQFDFKYRSTADSSRSGVTPVLFSLPVAKPAHKSFIYL